jgi:tetratricopeptide (TPR) repeat protein
MRKMLLPGNNPRGAEASTVSSVRELNEHYSKGIEFFDQGLYREAISEFEIIIQTVDSSDPACKLAKFYLGEAHAQLGLERAYRGASVQAEGDLRRAIDINPKYPDLHYHLARVYIQKGEYQQAVSEFETALALNPRYARALFELGMLRYRMGERELGMEMVSRAVDIEPGYSNKLYREALAAHKTRHWNKTLSKLEELSETNVDDISYHFRLGKDHYKRGDYQSAIGDFERALSIQPGYADIRNWLGLAYLAAEEPSKALIEFSRALEINPNFIAARINAGAAFTKLDCLEEASQCYRRVLEIDPDNTEARERLAELQLRG